MTTEQKTQAADLLRHMIENDFSRQSMDARLDEVEITAIHRIEDLDERKNILAITGEVRRLITKDRKLATAGLLAGRNVKPYSQL